MFKIIRILVSSDTCLCSSVSPPGPTRRRVKSAQEPLHRQLSLGPAPSPAPATPLAPTEEECSHPVVSLELLTVPPSQCCHSALFA